MSTENRGYLVIIGGAEDKEGRREILSEFIRLCGERPTIGIVTSATQEPKETGKKYEDIFASLGADKVYKLKVQDRSEANSDSALEDLRQCDGIFFTGGDQLRITTTTGGTKFSEELKELYKRGAVIAGTSAGASVMSETMITSGNDDAAAKKCTLKMAPGLALIDKVIIDQHFAQRGRIGRLITAVAQNPEMLGVGIDEDTAIVVTPHNEFEVIGSQSVTILDGRGIIETNISELAPDELLSVFNVTLHVLPSGYGYDLQKHKPYRL